MGIFDFFLTLLFLLAYGCFPAFIVICAIGAWLFGRLLMRTRLGTYIRSGADQRERCIFIVAVVTFCTFYVFTAFLGASAAGIADTFSPTLPQRIELTARLIVPAPIRPDCVTRIKAWCEGADRFMTEGSINIGVQIMLILFCIPMAYVGAWSASQVSDKAKRKRKSKEYFLRPQVYDEPDIEMMTRR